MNTAGATISPCGRYRYDLTREWGDGERVVWVMLNPSTADATKDDPTIRRCVGFSKSWGYGSLAVVNLFAARATDPKDLLTLGDPVGPENARVMDKHIAESGLVVAAWGTFIKRMAAKGHMRLCPEASAVHWRVPIVCLGRTKDGYPKHPLYVPANQTMWGFA